MGKLYHYIVAKTLYVGKRGRLDISLAIVFSTTRVKEPDININNWRKRHHLIMYPCSIRELLLVLRAVGTGTGVLHWYVNASIAVYPNMIGHTCGWLRIDQGCPLDRLPTEYTKLHSK